MLTVISPAKRLDWEGAPAGGTEPAFLADANRLAGHARQLSLANLKGLMGLSDDLARLNRDRFRAFSDAPGAGETRQAAFAFAGDTYQGLEAKTLDADALRWADGRLWILSGLYGLLRPGDAIQAYRLEMGSRLKTRRGASLYDFWGDRIAKALNAAAEAAGSDVLLNCASQEYFGAVDAGVLMPRVITPVFLEERGGTAKTVSFFAKRARGALARFVVENRVSRAAELAAFETGGYRLDPDRSEPDRPVFIRPYPEAGAKAA
ncbi:peroxide stress protein YaaA [Ovoidimarina sediminis]|uniref:peroxide stress protein YaaA n=1 Tax=Ovoidimarina sediminis TaxID=3079856 RepID=UPI00290DDFCC|nr:peroxide stress protein YaaA [Rhodophyticola sp. MJ-SS7]MDU8942453.1 peroxide stress protein YaaA [Rhodophyticola sp. MJ-SS7]